MILTYNDGTDLQIQSASIQCDGTLLIKTVSATEEDLRGMFGDELKTRKMVISERSQTVGEYEGYTTLEESSSTQPVSRASSCQSRERQWQKRWRH